MKIKKIDTQKSAQALNSVVKKTADIGKKAAEIAQKGANAIVDKAKTRHICTG